MQKTNVTMAVLAAAASFASLACGQSADDYALTFRGVQVNRDALDKLAVHPGVHAAVGWNSNPYLRPDTEPIRSAYVIDVDPQLDLEWPASEYTYLGLFGKLNLKYFIFSDKSSGQRQVTDTLEYRSFTDYSDEDNLIVQPYLLGKLRHNFSDHTSLALYDDFQMANVDKYGAKRRFYLNNAWVEALHEFTERVSGRVQYRNVWHYQNDDPALFNFQENVFAAAAPWRMLLLKEGRSVVLTPEVSYGWRAFSAGDAPLDLSRSADAQAKDYDFIDAGAGLHVPVSSLVTLEFTGGWKQRNYDLALAGQSDASDSVRGGATLSLTPSPGSPFTFVLAGSREVNDTVMYNTAEYNRLPFEWEDAVLNELNITYRELDVTRLGAWLRYDFSEYIRAYLIGNLQRSEASAAEDLAAREGHLSSTDDSAGRASDTKQDEVVYGGSLRLRLTESVLAGASYRHGFAIERAAPAGDRDLYEYDEVALQLNLDF